MPDLTEFLLARIADEEAAWREGGSLVTQPNFARLSRHMLADCEAKRRVAELDEPDAYGSFVDGWYSAHVAILRLLAAAYASHRDYRAEWATVTVESVAQTEENADA